MNDINLNISDERKEVLNSLKSSFSNIKKTKHFTTDWIPFEYRDKVNIISDDWQWDGKREDSRPIIYIEHGIGSIFCSNFKADMYLCITNVEYYWAIKNGVNAYYIGSNFNDETMPEKTNSKLLVYSPPHCLPIYNILSGYNYETLRKDRLWGLCKEYGCSDFLTSCTEDTPIEHYDNVIVSDRGNHLEHFAKCKYLYENAKIIYTDWTATFDITGQCHGIKVVRENDKTELPKDDYSGWRTPVDGLCKKRILDKIEEIICKNSK